MKKFLLLALLVGASIPGVAFENPVPEHGQFSVSALYNTSGREALSGGDKILSENYFQYADHFLRISMEEKEKDIQSNK